MKVIHIVLAALTVVLVAQSFLTACPTCLNQLDQDLVGEMEPHTFTDTTVSNDDILEYFETNGFTPYDLAVLGQLGELQNV